MTAETRIVVDQRTDVVRVPVQALRYSPRGVAADGTAPTGNSERSETSFNIPAEGVTQFTFTCALIA